MDERRIGALLRASRLAHRLRQVEVGRRAGVSQQTVSRIERGDYVDLGVGTVLRVARAAGLGLHLEADRPADAARLRDARHAGLVELVVARISRTGWQAVVEYSFAHYGERGSVDVLAWHAASSALLIVEVKTRIVDLQDLLSALDRKARLVPGLAARSRGWHAETIGVVLAVSEGRTSRRTIERHAAVFAAALPGTSRQVRRWLERPAGTLRGVWFLSDTRQAGSRQRRRPDQGRCRPARTCPRA